MATSSFADVSSWQSAQYQTIQSTIQQEVAEGLWENEDHVDGWCLVATSPPQGFNNLWVIYTYQLISDPTHTTTVVWPANWSAPAENINGQLPSYFFTGQVASSIQPRGGGGENQPFYQVYAPPSSRPTYKLAGDCL